MARHRVLIALVIAAASALGGCGSMNTYLTQSLGELPQWAGGLPPDAPPREGDPRYAAYIEEVRGKALVDGVKPAAATQAVATQTSATDTPKATVAASKPSTTKQTPSAPKPSIVSASPNAGNGSSIADQFIY
jgi:hypothetical protein